MADRVQARAKAAANKFYETSKEKFWGQTKCATTFSSTYSRSAGVVCRWDDAILHVLWKSPLANGRRVQGFQLHHVCNSSVSVGGAGEFVALDAIVRSNVDTESLRTSFLVGISTLSETANLRTCP